MDIADLAVKQGLGVASFVLLSYAVWQGLKFMDRLVNNHLMHIEETLAKMSDALEALADEFRIRK